MSTWDQEKATRLYAEKLGADIEDFIPQYRNPANK